MFVQINVGLFHIPLDRLIHLKVEILSFKLTYQIRRLISVTPNLTLMRIQSLYYAVLYHT